MFNKVKPLIEIYRLEAANGLGPFECDKYQRCTKFLSYHEDPIYMLEHIGMDEPKFNEITNKKHFIFGWSNEEQYHNFFQRNTRTIQNGENECYLLGMKKMKYFSRNYFIFPDGQVLFEPSKHHPSMEITPQIIRKRVRKLTS